jgi:hypothetical protein
MEKILSEAAVDIKSEVVQRGRRKKPYTEGEGIRKLNPGSISKRNVSNTAR